MTPVCFSLLPDRAVACVVRLQRTRYTRLVSGTLERRELASFATQLVDRK